MHAHGKMTTGAVNGTCDRHTFVQDAGDDWHRRVEAKRLFQDHFEVVELLQVFEPVSEKKVAAGCAHVSGA